MKNMTFLFFLLFLFSCEQGLNNDKIQEEQYHKKKDDILELYKKFNYPEYEVRLRKVSHMNFILQAYISNSNDSERPLNIYVNESHDIIISPDEFPKNTSDFPFLNKGFMKKLLDFIKSDFNFLYKSDSLKDYMFVSWKDPSSQLVYKGILFADDKKTDFMQGCRDRIESKYSRKCEIVDSIPEFRKTIYKYSWRE